MSWTIVTELEVSYYVLIAGTYLKTLQHIFHSQHAGHRMYKTHAVKMDQGVQHIRSVVMFVSGQKTVLSVQWYIFKVRSFHR